MKQDNIFFFKRAEEWTLFNGPTLHLATDSACSVTTSVSLEFGKKSALKAAKSSGFHSMGIARKQLQANSLFCKQDCRGDQCKKTNLKCTVTVELTVNISLLCALINTKTEDLCTNTPCTQFLLSFYSSVCEALTNN